MRRMAILLLMFTFFDINTFAQQPEINPEIVDFVNNSRMAPDYTNEDDWTYLSHATRLTEVPLLFRSTEDSSKDTVVMGIRARYYAEISSGLVAIVYSLVLDDRRDVEYGMLYGADDVYRYAIKIEDMWKIARKSGMPEMDKAHSVIHEKAPLFTSAPFNNKTGILTFKASLDTVDGIETVAIDVHMLRVDKKNLKKEQEVVV
jgi:hypothetical protein